MTGFMFWMSGINIGWGLAVLVWASDEKYQYGWLNVALGALMLLLIAVVEDRNGK